MHMPMLQVKRPGHSLSGSVPAATKPHVPSLPAPFFAAVHAWQTPEQAVLQHTPSTQTPPSQSLGQRYVLGIVLRPALEG